jgi:putative IMPACT (imprinted ancient) family translation regulator
MNCIQSLYKAQIEVKKSKFISYLVPIDDFKNLYELLKKEHLKANHIVCA